MDFVFPFSLADNVKEATNNNAVERVDSVFMFFCFLSSLIFIIFCLLSQIYACFGHTEREFRPVDGTSR